MIFFLVFSFMNFMNGEGRTKCSKRDDMLTCSCSALSQSEDPFLTPSRDPTIDSSFLFTILPPNLIQLLKNEIFEESATRRKFLFRTGTKKDLKLIRHQQHTNLIERFFALKAILYCAECEAILLPFVNGKTTRPGREESETKSWKKKRFRAFR